MLKQGIGICYVEAEFTKADEVVYIDIRGRRAAARVTDVPFYDTDIYGATRKRPPLIESRKA